MVYHGKNRAMLAEGIDFRYLTDVSRQFTVCSYCGRTVVFSALYKHWRVWHGYETKDFIIDF